MKTTTTTTVGLRRGGGNFEILNETPQHIKVKKESRCNRRYERLKMRIFRKIFSARNERSVSNIVLNYIR